MNALATSDPLSVSQAQGHGSLLVSSSEQIEMRSIG
jgi:hypothetical protein